MRQEDMEVYPILHKERVYNVITELDLSFTEVHAMLDWLNEHGAFDPTEDDESMGPSRLFTCELEGVTLEVDVQGFEVIIYRRSLTR